MTACSCCAVFASPEASASSRAAVSRTITSSTRAIMLACIVSSIPATPVSRSMASRSASSLSALSSTVSRSLFVSLADVMPVPMTCTVPPTAPPASSMALCASRMVTDAAANRLSAPSITSFRDTSTFCICAVSCRAEVSLSMMPSARSWLSSPMALHTVPTVVSASAALPTTVVLICSCTAVLALLVILGAMAFFFSFS